MDSLLTLKTFKQFVILLIIFLAIDMVWLLVVAKSFYAKHLGYLMAEKPNLTAAFIFYLIFTAGLLVFVVQPALAAGSLQKALTVGLFFGLVTYATYDLTNHATIRDWPLLITLVDMIWGCVISALTATLGYLAIDRLL